MNRRKKQMYYNSYSGVRKPKMRWDRIAAVIAVAVLVIGILVWFNLSRIQLAMKGYSLSQQNAVLALNSTDVDEILSHEKMDHIQDWINESQEVEYYDEYEQYSSLYKQLKPSEVVASVDTIFGQYFQQLQSLGYNDQQVWDVLKVVSSDDLKYIIEKSYRYEQLQPYMHIQGFQVSKMDQYIEVYKEKNSYSYAVLSIAYPGVISENKSGQVYIIQKPDDILNLVKKGFQLSPTYVPSDLKKPDMPVAPDCDDSSLRKEAADALTQMTKDAKAVGYNLVLNSAYRSYADQKKVYDEIFNKYDPVTAASLVALPGASEHQTGLGVDLTSQSVLKGERLVFGDTVEYKWCIENAYRYGFILRFEEDKANITGIGKEPWHFRYVGKEAANKIYENKWTLEEYCLYEGVIPSLKEKQ